MTFDARGVFIAGGIHGGNPYRLIEIDQCTVNGALLPFRFAKNPYRTKR